MQRLEATAVVMLLTLTSCGGPAGPEAVNMVDVVPAADTLTAVGSTVQLTAVAKDYEGRVIEGLTFTWSSDREDVATVSANGLVMASGPGSVYITAELQGGVGGSSSLISVFTTADIIPDSVTLALGQTWRLLVETDGIGEGAESIFRWVSSDASVATVDSGGVVTALSAGTTTVTATIDGILDSVRVTVSSVVQLEWRLEGSIGGSTAIAPDGTIYASASVTGGDYSLPSTKLAAISPDGTQRWSSPGGGSAPVVGADGTVYSGMGMPGRLFAIDPDGNTRWTIELGFLTRPIAALASDGTVYVGGTDKTLRAFNPDGTEIWAYTAGGGGGTPSIGFDGTIYVAGENLYAVNPDGTQKWEFLGDGALGTAAIGADGTIYVGSFQHLYAINSDGTERWKFWTERTATSSPVIGIDGTVYLASDDVALYAIRPDGTTRWEFRLADGWHWTSSPILAADGTIYVMSTGPWRVDGGHGSVCYALNSDGSIKWKLSTEGFAASPAVSADGTIYFGSGTFRSSYFYAISETAGSNGGLADSAWPKPGHDSRNTGNVTLR